jgi:hypothetical protein
VWFDINDDFSVGASEPVVAEVVVNASDSSGVVKKTSTDSQGKYMFTGLSSGLVTVTVDVQSSTGVTALRDSDGGSDWRVAITIGASESKVANFSARGSRSISGTVRDDSTNGPIQKASISCSWAGISGSQTPSTNLFTTVSQKDGSFSLSGVPSGKFSCEATDSVSGSRSSLREVVLDAQSSGSNASTQNLDLKIRKMSLLPSTGFDGSLSASFVFLLLGLVLLVSRRQQIKG